MVPDNIVLTDKNRYVGGNEFHTDNLTVVKTSSPGYGSALIMRTLPGARGRDGDLAVLSTAFSASGGVRFLAPVRRRLPNDERRRVMCELAPRRDSGLCARRAQRATTKKAPGPPARGGGAKVWMLMRRSNPGQAGPGLCRNRAVATVGQGQLFFQGGFAHA